MAINTHIPVELMELLNTIRVDISEVKERLIRIEAQDHHDAIKTIQSELKEEREKRTALEIEIANIKTKLAPIVVGLSLLGAGLVDIIGRIVLK